MGNVGGVLVHEIDSYSQPKSVGLNHVLFVLINFVYCIDVYQHIAQVLLHRHMMTRKY